MHTLTDAEIDTLTGRELDAVVAQFVEGWAWVEWPASTTPRTIRAFKHPEKFVYGSYGPKDEPIEWRDALPAYSTDIAAAWQVVERLLKTAGYNFSLFSLPNETDGGETEHWNCNWHFDQYIAADVEKADTAPLAICRAALRAVREGTDAAG